MLEKIFVLVVLLNKIYTSGNWYAFGIKYAKINKLNTSIMKNSTYKSRWMKLRSKGILVLSGALLLVSCGAQMGIYTETDGIYYDPKKDIIPERSYAYYESTAGDTWGEEAQEPGIIEQNRQNELQNRNRYNSWSGVSQSDWGTFAGTESSFNSWNNWGWGGFGWGWNDPWMWGGRWGMGLGFGWGWNDPWMWGNRWGMGLGWGWNSWNWGWGWNAGWGFGGPWFNPYWDFGWGNPWFFGRPVNYKRSGPDMINRGNSGFSNNSNFNRGFNGVNPQDNRPYNVNSANSNGFRRSGFGAPSSVSPNPALNSSSNSGFRRSNYTPSSNYSTPRNESFRNNAPSGFGSGSSGSSGGFRGGSSGSSGGGFRGGFR